jgi:hypothetical protein
MNLKISGYGEIGDKDGERIGINILKDCNAKNYILVRTTSTEKGFYNKPSYTYWFTPRELKAGDKIVLYTKTGTDKASKQSDGTTTFFLYWGLDNPILKENKASLVLAEIENWQVEKIQK